MKKKKNIHKKVRMFIQTNIIWKLPENVNFLDASNYYDKLQSIQHQNLFIDLSMTQYIHASFIGFLIYAKQYVQNQGYILNIFCSLPVKRLLEMLQLYDFFHPGNFTLITPGDDNTNLWRKAQ